MEPLWISLFAALISVLLSSLISALAARVRFSAKPGLRWALDILFLLPLVVPCVAVAIRLGNLFDPLAIMVAESLPALPLFYFCALMGFRKVSHETVDAARLQGLGRCGIFWRVWFPPAWPWIGTGLALGLLRSATALALAYA